jgi:uncharacterized protein (DUF924 family)
MLNVTTRILDFWFSGEDTPQSFWFKSTPEIDAQIRDKFLDIHTRAVSGEFDGQITSADDFLAIIIVFDQFPRNMFRGADRAFATDPLARQWARLAIERGHDLAQPAPNRRMFFYLPLEHSENLKDQDEAVRLFEKMGYNDLTDYARAHRDVIKAYGRFPHRNAFLGRSSTPDEEAYLSRPGAGF